MFKIVLTIVLLILGLASVVAPKYCCKNKPYWFSVGNMFSAGVLLSAAIVHSLSDANGTIFYESSKIPYANMICGFSFLVMLLIEEVGHSAHESMETNNCHSAEASTESQIRRAPPQKSWSRAKRSKSANTFINTSSSRMQTGAN